MLSLIVCRFISITRFAIFIVVAAPLNGKNRIIGLTSSLYGTFSNCCGAHETLLVHLTTKKQQVVRYRQGCVTMRLSWPGNVSNLIISRIRKYRLETIENVDKVCIKIVGGKFAAYCFHPLPKLLIIHVFE